MLEPVAARLAEMAGAGEQYEHSGRAAGAFRCAVGGDRFSVRVAIEPLDEGPVVQLVLADESRAAG